MIKLKKILKENQTLFNQPEDKVIFLGEYRSKELYLLTLESKEKYESHINLKQYKEKLTVIGEGTIKYIRKFIDDNSYNIGFPFNTINDEVWDTKTQDYMLADKYIYHLSILGNTNYYETSDMIDDLFYKLQKFNKNYFILAIKE